MNGWWEAFWFFLPAGVANMSPVLANRLPVLRNWRTPLDLGITYKGRRLLGDNKTWRGLLFGAFAGAVIGFIQYRVVASSAESTLFILTATGMMGFGALLGDAIESFFKRRVGVKAGDSWFPFDQLDYIIGGLVFASLFVVLSFGDIIRVILIYFVLHLIVSYLTFKAGWKEKPI